MTSDPSDGEGAFVSPDSPRDLAPPHEHPLSTNSTAPQSSPLVAQGEMPSDPRFTPPEPPASPPISERGNGPTRESGTTGRAGSLTRILITLAFWYVVTLARKALAEAHNDPDLPHVYRMADNPVLIQKDDAGHFTIKPVLVPDHMKEILSKVASFAKPRQKEDNGDVPVHPPYDVCKAIIADPGGLPLLKGVTPTPILRLDGSVHQEPGYDTMTGFYYDPAGMTTIAVPEQPMSRDVRRALKRLLKPFAKFPFKTPADRAMYLALLLTLVVRPIIPGNVPLIVIGSPIQGSGKSILANCANILVTGGMVALMVMPERGGDDEVRKRLTATLTSNPLICIIDNITGKVDWPSLASILTTGKWADRLLQKSRMVTLTIRTVFVATGVNMEIAGDMARRSGYINLDPGVEKPWERKFRFDPEGFVRKHRAKLLEALFTLVRYWFNQGKPMWSGTPFGSFENWASIVGGILQAAGIEGFLENRDAIDTAANREATELAVFYEAWIEVYGHTPQRAAEVARELAGKIPKVEVLRQSLPEDLLPIIDQYEGHAGQRLGKALGMFKNRIAGNYKLVAEMGNNKTLQWAVVSANPAPDGSKTPGFPVMSGDAT